MPQERGAVYKMALLMTMSGGLSDIKDKYCVILQDFASMDRNATNFAFVIASSDRTRGNAARDFEVQLDEDDGFERPTIVDGRWVYTANRATLGRVFKLETL